MKNSKLSPLAVLIICAVFISAVGAYIGHYLLTKPASVTVEMNLYGVELYENSACTIIATAIEFPSIISGDISGQLSTTAEYFVKSTTGGSVGWALVWKCEEPASMILTGDIRVAPNPWEAWAEDSGVHGYPAGIVVSVRWTLNGNGASVGVYDFEIDIITGEYNGS
jgi:hypothetical protein